MIAGPEDDTPEDELSGVRVVVGGGVTVVVVVSDDDDPEELYGVTGITGEGTICSTVKFCV
jgi:hypothetical protein